MCVQTEAALAGTEVGSPGLFLPHSGAATEEVWKTNTAWKPLASLRLVRKAKKRK